MSQNIALCGALLLLSASACSSSGNVESSVDASLEASASDASMDTTNDATTFVTCSASLASVCNDAGLECPPPLASDLPGPWCAQREVIPIRGSCGGYTLLIEGFHSDTAIAFFYALDGGALEAVFGIGDPENFICEGANPGFAIPANCVVTGEDESATFSGPGSAPDCDAGSAGD